MNLNEVAKNYKNALNKKIEEYELEHNIDLGKCKTCKNLLVKIYQKQWNGFAPTTEITDITCKYKLNNYKYELNKENCKHYKKRI